MIEAFLSHPFLLMALLAGTLASITGGIIGTYVVVKRIVFIAGSIAHSVLGGMGLCLWLKRSCGIHWISPIHGALIAALLSAFIVGWIHLRYKQREDTVIAAIWSTGMAIGVIFIALTPGYNVELTNFLFGNILWVTKADLVWLAILDLVVIGICFLWHQKFLAICFDENQAALQGLSVTKTYLLLLSLVAISVVVLIEVVGAILVIAMLAIPAAIAGSFAQKLSQMIALAILFGVLFTLIGLIASFQLNWPSGACIALTSALFYLGSLSLRGRNTSQ